MDQPKFPADENGQVLRRMFEDGDDLTRPRNVDFCFVFPDRKRALDFIRSVNDRDLENCLSFYEEKNSWQVIVKRYMVPDHGGITGMELALTKKAEIYGGTADGWGCMRLAPKNAY